MCKILEDFGREEREEGKIEAKKELALRMLKSGKYPIEDIAELAGFSVEQLQKLEAERRP